jgi:hypothetical protein
MLRVIVELVPGGYAPLRRTIATMNIGNVTDLADVSDYKIDATEAANPLTGTGSHSGTCVVRHHDRRQSVWALIAKAADEIKRAEFNAL